MKKKLLYIVIILVVIQFIPYGKDHTNPKVVNEPNWDSVRTKELFYKACGDCHSNKTKWPSYSNIAPISWIIAHHIDEGREHLNINENPSKKDIKEAIEETEEDEMPPFPYKLMHKEARLSKKEKKDLINGLKNTFLK